MTSAPTSLSVFALFGLATPFVKIIMLTLLGLSVAVWAIVLEKMRTLRTLNARADKFEKAFWQNEGLEDLYRNTRPEQTDHPMAFLYVSGLREWQRAQEAEDESQNGGLSVGIKERVEQLLYADMNRIIQRLESYIPVLATVGSTAPFIGLLGTVWGIMHAFQNIGVSQNTSLAVVAPGIAEALLATAIGLFAAIPSVIAYNKISTDLGRYITRMENFVVEFVHMLDRQQSAGGIKKGRKGRREDAA